MRTKASSAVMTWAARFGRQREHDGDNVSAAARLEGVVTGVVLTVSVS